eukprot:scaffold26624_cov19-Tisochrysis_lutea.AAC.1
MGVAKQASPTFTAGFNSGVAFRHVWLKVQHSWQAHSVAFGAQNPTKTRGLFAVRCIPAVCPELPDCSEGVPCAPLHDFRLSLQAFVTLLGLQNL